MTLRINIIGMKKRLSIIIFLLPIITHAQIITLFAGGGTSGLGDGGLATSAQVPDPVGGTFDRYGNYYCAEGDANRIRKVNNVNIITTIAGNGAGGFTQDSIEATDAELNLPWAVKIDSADNVYICDGGNNRVRKVDAITGVITTFAGTGVAGYGGDNGSATTALLNDPQDICFDKQGNLYIADQSNNRIRKIDMSGVITTIAGTGTPGFTGDNAAATAAELRSPQGLAIDDTGNLYIAGGNVVRKVNTSGIITTVAGVDGMFVYSGDGIPATNAPMYPIKIAIDPLGQLIIADYSNDRVFRVDLTGIIYTIAGNGIAGHSGDNGPATDAEFDYPAGLTFDSCGNLYITDVGGGGRIRKVSLNPACWPEAVENTIKTTAVNIYPNPTYSTITITAPTLINNVTITNMLSQQVYAHSYSTSKAEIDVSNLPQGVYTVRVNDTYVQKLVKE